MDRKVIKEHIQQVIVENKVKASYNRTVLNAFQSVLSASKDAAQSHPYSDQAVNYLVTTYLRRLPNIENWRPGRGVDCYGATSQLIGYIRQALIELGSLEPGNNTGFQGAPNRLARQAYSTLSRGDQENQNLVHLISNTENINHLMQALDSVLRKSCSDSKLGKLLRYHLPLGLYKATIGWWNPLDVITYEGKSLSAHIWDHLENKWKSRGGDNEAPLTGNNPPTP